MGYRREAPGQSDPDKMAYSTGNTGWNSVVGQRNGLSLGDVQQTVDMYQCSTEVTCVDDPNYKDEYGDCDAWSRWVESGDNKCESFTEDCPYLPIKCRTACGTC